MFKQVVRMIAFSGAFLALGAPQAKDAEKAKAPEKAMAPMQEPAKAPEKGMGMMAMGGGKGMECKAKADSLDALLKTVKEARLSNDKAKMGAALSAVEAQLGGMKEHMEKCGKMMEMMEEMGGGMGMKGMNPGDGAHGGTKDSAGAGPSEHEKHHPK